MLLRASFVAIVFLPLTSAWLEAQRPPPPPKPPPSQPQLEPVKPRHRSEMFLSGRVLMADGSALLEGAKVNLSCSASPILQVRVSPDGTFSIVLGSRPNAAIMDASVSGAEADIYAGSGGSAPGGLSSRLESSLGPGQANLSGCSLEAELAGFRSSVLQLGIRNSLDSPDVGDIFLIPAGKSEGPASVSVTSLAAPEKAVKSFKKARQEFAKRKFDKAAREAEKAVGEYPEFAVAWHLLGDARQAGGDREGAAEAFERAGAADPDYLPPLLAAARIHVQDGRPAAAAELTDRVLLADPRFWEAWYVNALSRYNLGEPAAALAAIESYLSRPDDVSPAAILLHGFILAANARYPEAAAALERFIGEAPAGPPVEQARLQLERWRRQGRLP